ncbi:hypothetical protein BYT27DRAFT_7143386, partial [Phlegmacium glaucopus]
MTRQITDDLRARIIVWHHEFHLSPHDISGLAGCSIRTVYYILSYHHNYNTFRDPTTRGSHGRKREMNMGDMNYIASLIDARP